jgi:hypothetical protein
LRSSYTERGWCLVEMLYAAAVPLSGTDERL